MIASRHTPELKAVASPPVPMSDGEMRESSGDDDDVGFADAPPVQRVEPSFTALDSDGCRAMANTRVAEVKEVLCCDAAIAAMLLRFFRWDKEKLMEGKHTSQ